MERKLTKKELKVMLKQASKSTLEYDTIKDAIKGECNAYIVDSKVTNRHPDEQGSDLVKQLEMCKENENEGDNLKSVYLTDGEIDYLIGLIHKTFIHKP